MTMNRQWRLKQTVTNTQSIGRHQFEWHEVALPKLKSDEVLVKTLCLGTSPAQRGYISDKPSMHAKVPAGDVMRGRGVGVVIESKNPEFLADDIVVATTGWQDYSVHTSNPQDPFAIRKLAEPCKPYALALGILGAAGITAYHGLLDVGKTKAGDCLVVSAAAGGVGSCAIQIGKKLGCTVIGIAGGKKKCTWVRETLGADHSIDYKTEDLNQRLADLCPTGVDVFFDNVGGEQLQTVLTHLSLGARIAICGFISTDYSTDSPGPSNYIYLLKRRARMQGFFIFDYVSEFEKTESVLTDWYHQGFLVDSNDILEGLENMPEALQSLFSGTNLGVRLCRVSPDP